MIAFTLLTFAASWLLWGAAVWILGGDFAHPGAMAPLGNAVYLVGVFAPAIVAIALTWMHEGAAGLRGLFERMLVWDVRPRWYALAILYYPAVHVTVAIAYRLARGSWPVFSTETIVVMLVATVFSTPVQAGEELGWRGFLLPRAAGRLGLPAASLLVGVIWAAWHLPFFFFAGTDKTGQSFPAYLAGVTALSVAMAFLYWRTNGSLLLTMVMHAAFNNIRLLAPTPSHGDTFGPRAPFTVWATVALMWVAAVVFLTAMRGARLPEDRAR